MATPATQIELEVARDLTGKLLEDGSIIAKTSSGGMDPHATGRAVAVLFDAVLDGVKKSARATV